MATTTALSPATKKPWNSLQRLKAGLGFLIVVDALFLTALIMAANKHSELLNTVGVASAPSVVLAQKIKVEIGTMDAEAANELLAKPGEGQAARNNFAKSRDEVAEALVDAAKNITYSGERKAIRDLELGLGKYETTVQRARDFHDRGDPQALQIYRKDFDIKYLFDRADDLAKVNDQHLEDAFSDDRSSARWARLAAMALGSVLFGLLIFVQWDLIKKTKRLVNPALLAASILTLGLTVSDGIRLSKASEDLRIAKEEAFDSLHYLWQCRAYAYAANADESKYLLNEDGRADEVAFFEKAQAILPLDDPKNENGLLGKELHNITFLGEKEAALQAINTWKQYMAIDSQIRQLQRAKRHDDAVKLCLGDKQGQSDWAFSQFDGALMQTIGINQKAFENALHSGFRLLEEFNIIASIATGIIAICCCIGLFIRIREFL